MQISMDSYYPDNLQIKCIFLFIITFVICPSTFALPLQQQDTSPRLSCNSSDDTSNLHDTSFSASSVGTSAAMNDFNQEEAKAKIKKQKKKLKAADRLIELLKKQIQLNKGEFGESLEKELFGNYVEAERYCWCLILGAGYF